VCNPHARRPDGRLAAALAPRPRQAVHQRADARGLGARRAGEPPVVTRDRAPPDAWRHAAAAPRRRRRVRNLARGGGGSRDPEAPGTRFGAPPIRAAAALAAAAEEARDLACLRRARGLRGRG